jgi:hypothetical protein
MNGKALSEWDICNEFITPALMSAKWDLMSQIPEEVSFTKGRVIVRGQLSTRGEPKRANYLFYLKPTTPPPAPPAPTSSTPPSVNSSNLRPPATRRVARQ